MTIGTSTSGPPVPVTDDRNPVTVPIINRAVLEILYSAASSLACARNELSPEKNVRSPRHASSSRGLTTLTAHAPANDIGVAPRQSHVVMSHRIDRLRANTIVATRPDKM